MHDKQLFEHYFIYSTKKKQLNTLNLAETVHNACCFVHTINAISFLILYSKGLRINTSVIISCLSMTTTNLLHSRSVSWIVTR